MRAVIDTNVLLSGVLWRGTPHRLLERVRSGALTLITSPALLAEFEAVIRRSKFQDILARSGVDAVLLLGELRRLGETIAPPPLPAPVSRDPDDDAVLALAIAAQADLVVSGDEDLLALGTYAGIPIVDPASALTRIDG